MLEPRVDPSYVAREELRVSAGDAANVPVNALGYVGQGSGVPSFGVFLPLTLCLINQSQRS